MKRAGSPSLDGLLGASVKRRATTSCPAQQRQKLGGLKTNRGLASRADVKSTAGGDDSIPAARPAALPDVSSPRASKPQNFAEPPAMPASPFAAVGLPCVDGAPACPWLADEDSDQAQAISADTPAVASWRASGRTDGDTDDWDRENQRPGKDGSSGGTWLFSPVRPRGRPPSSLPLTIPSPSPAGLASPALPTPVRAAPFHPAGSLQHAPSFSSWMVPATRPPSPKRSTPPGGAVADVAANVLADVTAARRFDGARPSQLDFLLAELGDTHYPASIMQWEHEELPDSPDQP